MSLLARAASPPPRGPRGWWEHPWFLALLVAASALPLAYPQVPPLVDLLGHMGRYRVQLDLDTSPYLHHFYDFKWAAIGNLGVDLLVELLAPLLGLERAVKLIVISIPMLTTAGFLWVAHETHRRIPPTAFFALPFAYSFPFLFGFVNYALAMALAMLAFALWIRLGRLHHDRLRAILFVPISIIIFFVHAFGWGMLGLLCFSFELIRHHDSGATWIRSAIRATIRVLVMAIPLLFMVLWRSGSAKQMTYGWFNFHSKLQWVHMALRDRFSDLDEAAMWIVLALIIFSVFSRWLEFSRNLFFSGCILLIAFILVPWTIFGSAYADMRIAPYMIAVFILAIRFKDVDAPRLATALAIAGLAMFAGRLAIVGTSLKIAADEQAVSLRALDRVPMGARMVNFVGRPCREQWPLMRNSHIGGMAIARREAFSNDQWAIDGANLLSVRFHEAAPVLSDPRQMVFPNECGRHPRLEVDYALRSVPRAAIDYIWTVDLPKHDPSALEGYRLDWSEGVAQLYVREGLETGKSR